MIKIGIVGAGIIAKAHSESIARNSESKLVAVCDIVKERAEVIARPYNAKVFSDYKEMASWGDVDVVILNLPHYLHCEVSCFFLEKGINVFVEKPMAMNVNECDKMIAAAKKHNVSLTVGHVQQYTDAHKYLKEIIKNKKYGKLLRVTEVRNINYFNNRPEWFLNKKLSGGGIVMNYCAHTLDKLFYLTDSVVKSACSICKNEINDCSIEEGAQILVKLANGVSAMFSYTGSKVPYEYETVFYFENSVIKVGFSTKLTIFEDGKWLTVIDEESKMNDRAIDELVKELKGLPSEITTAAHGKAVIEGIEKIYKSSL